MRLLDLFIASSMPVLKVLLLTALGSFLAMDRINVVGEDARKHLNNVVFYVFNPALVGSNLAKTITRQSLAILWYMAVNILLTFIIGSVLGFIVIHATRAPRHLRGLILGCCAAGNMGNMLLIIIPAVCKEKGTPFGDPDVCHAYGMAYVSLSMAVGAICLWSYVYNIMRLSSNGHPKEVVVSDSANVSSPHKPLLSESMNSGSGNCEEPLFHSNGSIAVNHHAQESSLPCTRFDNTLEETLSDKMERHGKDLIAKINLKALLAPSTVGAVLGFLVGLVPAIRRSLIGDGAPLHVIQDSALLLGDGAIPSITLVMGGNLLKGLRGTDVHTLLIVGIIIARYVALPLMGLAIVKGAIHLGWVPKDPLYEFVLLLHFAVPPAMNIGTLTQKFGTGESECSVIMLWCYALASVSLTFWSTFFMWLVA